VLRRSMAAVTAGGAVRGPRAAAAEGAMAGRAKGKRIEGGRNKETGDVCVFVRRARETT